MRSFFTEKEIRNNLRKGSVFFLLSARLTTHQTNSAHFPGTLPQKYSFSNTALHRGVIKINAYPKNLVLLLSSTACNFHECPSSQWYLWHLHMVWSFVSIHLLLFFTLNVYCSTVPITTRNT